MLLHDCSKASEVEIERSVSSHVFTSIVHAFVCSRIDYCNSLLVGLPKVRLSPIQSALNAAARLVGDFLVRPTSLPSCLTIFIGYHSDTTQGSHIDLPLAYWTSSQVFT